MMDVHPPHEPIHGWRDFLLHLLTITIGLLIALGLEGCVEWQHHRHLVDEAKTNLHSEIRDNQRAIESDITHVKQAESRMKANIAILRELRAHGSLAVKSMSYTLDWDGPSASSWNTARDTGALTLMSYKDVQSYSDIYVQQEIAQSLAVRLFEEQSAAAAPLFTTSSPDKLTDTELEAMLQSSAVVYTRLLTLEQVSDSLNGAYKKKLTAERGD